jgi:hypothetical protein
MANANFFRIGRRWGIQLGDDKLSVDDYIRFTPEEGGASRLAKITGFDFEENDDEGVREATKIYYTPFHYNRRNEFEWLPVNPRDINFITLSGEGLGRGIDWHTVNKWNVLPEHVEAPAEPVEPVEPAVAAPAAAAVPPARATQAAAGRRRSTKKARKTRRRSSKKTRSRR